MRINAFIKADSRARDGLADIRIQTEAEQQWQLDLPFADLYRRCGVPSIQVLDLLITASVCYIVDKTVPRTSAEDNWTRDIQLSVPVSDPQAWKKLAPEMSETLTFLTGDEWSLSFSRAAQPLFEPPKGEPLPDVGQPRFKTVCLFSGGLDSLAGAIDLLSEPKNGKVLLIGHYDGPGPRKVQEELASALCEVYPERVAIEHVRVAHRPPEAEEETLRSRSLVFLALGLYCAQAAGPKIPLHMFENGFIALNVPLTPSRRSSCSTRTMHPYFLSHVRSIVAALGISNAVINPYALKTKGECLTGCRNMPLLSKLIDISVSCSHFSRRQDWIRKNARNCGYCVPCICRRAALYKAGLDNGQCYGRDILSGELTVDDSRQSANDLRAITDFLASPVTPVRLRKTLLAVTQIPDFDGYIQMACRGFAEIDAWLSSRVVKSATVKHA